MCNNIAVMFNGKLVEIGPTEELLQNPVHPYTKRLISSIPIPDPTYKREYYEIDFTELRSLKASNPNVSMVDLGNNHLISTDEFEGLLY